MNKKAIKSSKNLANRAFAFALIAVVVSVMACNVEYIPADSGSSSSSGGSSSGGPSNVSEVGQVVRVIDGDTIDVNINGSVERVRYVGVNTPERDEPCYQEAKDANAALVDGQTVSLVRDVSETDRYDRLLRFVYVGNTFVNDSLVRNGWAEAVLYEPDDLHHDEFVALERSAAAANLGCHPTGIFDDGSTTR